MSQHDDTNKPDTGAKNDYKPAELEIYVTPAARYRKRADGGMDETYRIQFARTLTEQQMSAIARLLLAMPEEQAQYGFTALTMLEFLEPDICDYRFWCARFHSDRLVATWELWQRIHHEICPIYSVDGVRYSFLFKQDAQS